MPSKHFLNVAHLRSGCEFEKTHHGRPTSMILGKRMLIRKCVGLRASRFAIELA
jgi:hypothetical protein